MCGICGYVGWNDPDMLDNMMTRIVHRGPDEEGRHLEPGVALGIRRLQVIDPEGGHQPISNETGTVWVVLNGEIYNYRELREELIAKGHRFQTHSDTEVLVHLYEQEGEEGIQRIRGMFAFALWDREHHTFLIARDRFGMKPLYYAFQEEGVTFASELPALLAAVPTPSLRYASIVEYMTLLYIPSPTTIFEGIFQLPPGNLMKIQKGHVNIRPFATLDASPSPTSGTSQQFEEWFLEELRDSVQAHLVSDVPLGLFLSGGLDSASILAMMRKILNGPIRTFSIGYANIADQSYDELSSAKLLADHFGTVHTEEQLSPDVVSLLPSIVKTMGEPFADSSAIPTYLVSQIARRSVTVALSGIGGDELFGGYPRHMGIRLASHYEQLPQALRRWISQYAAPWLPESTKSSDPVGRIKRFLSHGGLPLPSQYWQWISFLPAVYESSMFTPEFQEYHTTSALRSDYCQHFMKASFADPSDRAMGLDLNTYLPDDLLRLGDRLSMAHSLELRVPFCDHHLLDFARRVPVSVRFAGGQLKGLMRRALRSHLPSSILNGPKRGFMVPIGRWLREDLREMVHDLLSEDRVRRRGYLQPQYVQGLIRAHENGTKNFTDQLYALLVLELWHEGLSDYTVPHSVTPCVHETSFQENQA